jgi:hypothetical protein
MVFEYAQSKMRCSLHVAKQGMTDQQPNLINLPLIRVELELASVIKKAGYLWHNQIGINLKNNRLLPA